MVTTVEELRGLVLSATEVRNMTGWPSAMIEDYLTIIENLLTVSQAVDAEAEKKIEDIPTDFIDGSVPFAEGGNLAEDNPNLNFDNLNNILNAFKILSQSIEAVDVTITSTLETLNAKINSLSANMAVGTDASKNLISIPAGTGLNEETEFFIHAVC